MLNKLLKQLNGHGSDVESLDAALIQLGTDRETAQRELNDLQVRRHQALLDDADDKVLDRIERDIERAEVRIEKLDAAAPGLRERLDAARRDARRRRWDELHVQWRTAATDFLASARAACRAHDALTAVVAAAQAEGFSGDVAAHMPATPNLNGCPLLAPDLLELFERALDPRIVEAATAQHPQAQAAKARARLPHERVPITDSQRPVTLGISDSPRIAPQPSAADDVGPLEAGNVRVVVVRAGYQNHRGERCRAGWRGQMPRDLAIEAARGGALEIVAEPSATAATTGEQHV